MRLRIWHSLRVSLLPLPETEAQCKCCICIGWSRAPWHCKYVKTDSRLAWQLRRRPKRVPLATLPVVQTTSVRHPPLEAVVWQELPVREQGVKKCSTSRSESCYINNKVGDGLPSSGCNWWWCSETVAVDSIHTLQTLPRKT